VIDVKRKAIQLAGKTMVVSLPSKWVKSHNIIKGQDIDLEEKGRELIIKAEGEPEVRKAEFDTRGQSERMINWMLFSYNRRGYDEIELIYDKPEVVKHVQQAIKDFFIGFVIINQTKTRCIIKSVSKDSEEEFDNTLRRAFLVTLTMGENLLESLNTNDFESLENNLSLEKTNNQLTNFCQRILVKKGHPHPEKTCFYYVIIWNLEKVCDNYKYICEYLLQQKIKKITISKEFLSFMQETFNLLKDYYTLFYNYNRTMPQAFPARGDKLIREGREFLNSKKEQEVVIASILINQVTQIIDFVSSTISIMEDH
jgi:phosphate uptake regulator